MIRSVIAAVILILVVAHTLGGIVFVTWNWCTVIAEDGILPAVLLQTPEAFDAWLYQIGYFGSLLICLLLLGIAIVIAPDRKGNRDSH